MASYNLKRHEQRLNAEWEVLKHDWLDAAERIWDSAAADAERVLDQEWRLVLTERHIILGNRWIIATAIGVCLTSAFVGLHQSVFGLNWDEALVANLLPSILLTFFCALFVFDMFRMLVPLAYCSGLIEPRPSNSSAYDGEIPLSLFIRIIVVSIVTFACILMASRSLHSPLGYFLFLMLTQSADLFWYRKFRRADQMMGKAIDKVESILERLRKEAGSHFMAYTRGLADGNNFPELLDRLERRHEKMENELASEIEAIRGKIEKKQLELKEAYEKNIDRVNQLIRKAKKRHKFMIIALSDIATCFCIILMLALHYRIGEQLPEGGLELLEVGIASGVLLHMVNIYKDYKLNLNLYAQMLRGLASLTPIDNTGAT